MSSELLTVMGVTLITWLGVFAYMWRLDSKVDELAARVRKG
jgi:CcmD family protein